MKQLLPIYGLVAGLLIAGLRYAEYRMLRLDHALDLYLGLVAVLFTVIGLWFGRRLTQPAASPSPVRESSEADRVHVLRSAPSDAMFVRDAREVDRLGVTPRELDILDALAAGLSNREIAERLHVSENTVKTHATRLFSKLGARRRTQAVHLGKAAGLLP